MSALDGKETLWGRFYGKGLWHSAYRIADPSLYGTVYRTVCGMRSAVPPFQRQDEQPEQEVCKKCLSGMRYLVDARNRAQRKGEPT